MKKEYKILLITGLTLLACIFIYIAKFDFNPSSTIIFGEKYLTQLQEKDYSPPPGLVIFNDRQFDGQFFYTISEDLLQEKNFNSQFRYQRIVYPALAKLMSLGNTSLLPIAFILINLLAILLGTYLLIQILKKHEASLNLAYLWALNIGFVISLTRNLAEPLLFLFIIAAVYYLEKKQFKLSSLFLVLAILTKEIALIIIAPLLIYFLFKKSFKNVLIYSWPVLIYGIWQAFLPNNLGHMGLSTSLSLLGFPFWGILKYIIMIDLNQGPMKLFFYFSIIPILLFSLILLFVILRSSPKKISLYSFILIVQIFFIFSLNPKMYTVDTIDGVGRYAVAMFLFSILYSIERKQKYHLLLIMLSIFMSIVYFASLIILFQPQYFVT